MDFLGTDTDLASHSYYAATAPRMRAFPALEGRVDADVAVVGGGLAGLSAAIELADRGFDVVLLEARQIAWGASGRNGGQALVGLACDAHEIERQLGLAESQRIWAMTVEALHLIQQRCRRFDIDCDWRPGFLNLAVTARKARQLQAWQSHVQRHYGHACRWIAPPEMPAWIASPRFHSGLHDPLSGHLHPLKYALGLARGAAELGVRMHENSGVTALTPGSAGHRARLQTARGEVHTQQVLLAGNVYLQGLVPALQARVMPVGTYVIASEVLDPALAESLIPSHSAVCDTNFVLDYFRPTVDHRMVYGGGVSYSTATPRHLADTLQRRMARSFPQLAHTRAEFAWGGFVDITMNRAPDFGRLPGSSAGSSNVCSNIYFLQGFSGHGLALTGIAGKLVAEAMHGDASRFDVFARLRHRPFPGGALLRTPALVAGMAWYRLKDVL